jgi:hypothetical protein
MSSIDEPVKDAPQSHRVGHRVQVKAAKVAERAKDSGVVRLYGRLNAVDFMKTVPSSFPSWRSSACFPCSLSLLTSRERVPKRP